MKNYVSLFKTHWMFLLIYKKLNPTEKQYPKKTENCRESENHSVLSVEFVKGMEMFETMAEITDGLRLVSPRRFAAIQIVKAYTKSSR